MCYYACSLKQLHGLAIRRLETALADCRHYQRRRLRRAAPGTAPGARSQLLVENMPEDSYIASSTSCYGYYVGVQPTDIKASTSTPDSCCLPPAKTSSRTGAHTWHDAGTQGNCLGEAHDERTSAREAGRDPMQLTGGQVRQQSSPAGEAHDTASKRTSAREASRDRGRDRDRDRDRDRGSDRGSDRIICKGKPLTDVDVVYIYICT